MLRIGTEVHFVSDSGLIDHSTIGVIVDDSPTDPVTGFTHDDLREVDFDGEIYFHTVDNLTPID